MLEVKVGKSLSLGRVKIKRTQKRLKFEDGYMSGEYVVDSRSKVELLPLPPFYVPNKVADHLMIELETPIMVRGEMKFWVEGPYEMELRVNERRIAILTPLKVKHALYGDMDAGVVCRYYRSPVYEEPPERPEVAAVLVRARSETSGSLSSLVMHGSALTIFEKDGKYYYEVVDADVKESTVTVTLTDQPPVEGAIEVHKDSSILKAKFVMRW